MEKIVVVTGGGSGIGKAVAEMLPKEYTVIITGRTASKLENTAAEMNAKGHRIVCKSCDVSDRASVRKLAEEAAAMGEVVKVIHCAGISGSMGSSETITRINALGTVYVNQEFYKVMNGGVICDVASDSGCMLAEQMLPSEETYALALTDEAAFVAEMVKKAAITPMEAVNASVMYMISKNFARWYSRNCAYKYAKNKGIRVFSVSPGFVKTPMTDAEQGEATACMLSYSGLERGAEPEELAFLITMLADDRCSYLIGTDVMCDGGCVNNGYGMQTSRVRYDGRSAAENW
ncbi:MAG: SDR family oxidoreductase [Clostridia bacterium]|nr:SDR family oxidoreductase [Clostridia bacterium]